jgi:hypothetical protein
MSEFDWKAIIAVTEWANESHLEAEEVREITIRAMAAQLGYRLMHRRNGQYWVMFGDPMTLAEIEGWIELEMANK